jgi:hypothetical protein
LQSETILNVTIGQIYICAYASLGLNMCSAVECMAPAGALECVAASLFIQEGHTHSLCILWRTHREYSHFLTAGAARYFAHNTPLRYESVNKAKRVEEAAAARINMMDAPLWFGGGRYVCKEGACTSL